MSCMRETRTNLDRKRDGHEKDPEIGNVYFHEIRVGIGNVYFGWGLFILVRHSRFRRLGDKKRQL